MKFWNCALIGGALLAALAPANATQAADWCSFERGVTTCVATSETLDVQMRTIYGGCSYGPTSIPGRRVMVYEDTYHTTITTTTLLRGRSNRVFDTSSSSLRALINSQEISRTCEAL